VYEQSKASLPRLHTARDCLGYARQ
jgi:hypothetical protein